MKMRVFAFALVAAALSQTAGAITATKEYVDRKDTEIRTNTYTKAETDDRIAELAPGLTTNDVCAIVTNEVGEWSFDGLPDGAELFDWSWSVNSWHLGFSYDGKWFNGWANESEGYTENSKIIELECVDDIGAGFSYNVTASFKSRNALGLARLSDISNTVTKAYVEDLGIESGISAETATNIADTASAAALANADTTYRRTIGLTNLNQSVQYVNITDPAPTTLAISMPTDGATKDWMVYVTSVTNVSLVLPAATWWMADTAYTNDVPPATPTALWFSQVTDGIFILGRQELTEVAAP